MTFKGVKLKSKSLFLILYGVLELWRKTFRGWIPPSPDRVKGRFPLDGAVRGNRIFSEPIQRRVETKKNKINYHSARISSLSGKTALTLNRPGFSESGKAGGGGADSGPPG